MTAKQIYIKEVKDFEKWNKKRDFEFPIRCEGLIRACEGYLYELLDDSPVHTIKAYNRAVSVKPKELKLFHEDSKSFKEVGSTLSKAIELAHSYMITSK